jgi:hypothetical protein
MNLEFRNFEFLYWMASISALFFSFIYMCIQRLVISPPFPSPPPLHISPLFQRKTIFFSSKASCYTNIPEEKVWMNGNYCFANNIGRSKRDSQRAVSSQYPTRLIKITYFAQSFVISLSSKHKQITLASNFFLF